MIVRAAGYRQVAVGFHLRYVVGVRPNPRECTRSRR
jgi:hypothetical protein